jgi:hypothetical protein
MSDSLFWTIILASGIAGTVAVWLFDRRRAPNPMVRTLIMLVWWILVVGIGAFANRLRHWSDGELSPGFTSPTHTHHD